MIRHGGTSMTRTRIIAALALVAVVPAAAVGANSFLSVHDAPCFAAGSVGYQFTGSANADVVIKIDNGATAPDMTLQLVADPNVADFVLADGDDNLNGCGGIPIRTIRLDPQAANPDLVIALAPQARQKIYTQSTNFSAQDTAALFAVMSKSGHKFLAVR